MLVRPTLAKWNGKQLAPSRLVFTACDGTMGEVAMVPRTLQEMGPSGGLVESSGIARSKQVIRPANDGSEVKSTDPVKELTLRETTRRVVVCSPRHEKS